MSREHIGLHLQDPAFGRAQFLRHAMSCLIECATLERRANGRGEIMITAAPTIVFRGGSYERGAGTQSHVIVRSSSVSSPSSRAIAILDTSNPEKQMRTTAYPGHQLWPC